MRRLEKVFTLIRFCKFFIFFRTKLTIYFNILHNYRGLHNINTIVKVEYATLKNVFSTLLNVIFSKPYNYYYNFVLVQGYLWKCNSKCKLLMYLKKYSSIIRGDLKSKEILIAFINLKLLQNRTGKTLDFLLFTLRFSHIL